MSFQSLLNLTCSISRTTFGALKDAHGQPEEIATVETDIPCALQEIDGKEGRQDDQSPVARFKLWLSLDYSLLERDRVTVNGLVFDVLQVKNAAGRGHHQMAIVEAIK